MTSSRFQHLTIEIIFSHLTSSFMHIFFKMSPIPGAMQKLQAITQIMCSYIRTRNIEEHQVHSPFRTRQITDCEMELIYPLKCLILSKRTDFHEFPFTSIWHFSQWKKPPSSLLCLLCFVSPPVLSSLCYPDVCVYSGFCKSLCILRLCISQCFVFSPCLRRF